MADVADLVARLNTLGESVSSGETVLGRAEGAALVDACQRLVVQAEDPMMRLFKMTFDVDPFAAIRVAMKMGLIDAAVGSGKPSFTVDELSAWTKADPLLIVRIMRLLIHSRIFRETGPRQYATYPHTRLLASGSPLADTVSHSFDVHARLLIHLPDYLESTGFQNPDVGTKGPFQHTFNTEERFYDWIDRRPERSRTLTNMMEMLRKLGLEQWYTYYPIKERLANAAAAAAAPGPQGLPVIVDLGGREGTELRDLKRHIPELECELIVQDTPDTVALAKAKGPDPDVTLVAADLLEAQPVKGAAVYFMSKILHNWPDAEAVRILTNVAHAMSPASLLLLSDIVLPEEDVSLVHAFVDLTMMVEFSSLERTEKQWVALLAPAGLEIVKIWEPVRKGPGYACLIEARLKR